MLAYGRWGLFSKLPKLNDLPADYLIFKI